MEKNKDLIFDLTTIDRIIKDYKESRKAFMCFASRAFERTWDCLETRDTLRELAIEFLSDREDYDNFSIYTAGAFLFYLDTTNYKPEQEVTALKRSIRLDFLVWLREKIANN